MARFFASGLCFGHSCWMAIQLFGTYPSHQPTIGLYYRGEPSTLPRRMVLETVLTMAAVLVLLKGLAGMLEGRRYVRYIRRHLANRPSPWMPHLSVIVPCKGQDFELEQNVEALIRQAYPFFEILIVTASAEDPARPVLEVLARRFPGHRIRLLTAGYSVERGEKVHNLIEAVAQSDPNSQVLVFTDSDCRPHLQWLQELVCPLQDPQIGVSTGYRWYFPERRNFPGLLRSVWNGAIATLLGNHNHNFAWGGSMAIRRDTFDQARVLDFWRHSVSDDYSMTQAMKSAGLRIHYEPRCLIGSYGRCGWRELLDWSTRQMMVTKIYSRRFWRLALVSQWMFVTVWWWSLLGCLHPLFSASSTSLPGVVQYLWAAPIEKYLFLTGLLFLFGAVRGSYRVQAIRMIRPEHDRAIRPYAWGYILLFPLTSTLTAYNLLRTAFASTMLWRGVLYRFLPSGRVQVTRVDSLRGPLPPQAVREQ